MVPSLAADRQRRDLHRSPAWGRSLRDRAGTGRLGDRCPSRPPLPPQTCGKVERFHQTLKRWLVRQPCPSRSPTCRPSSTGSPATTTTSGRIQHWAAAPRGRLRRPPQGDTDTARAPGTQPLPRPPRQGRPHRGHHLAPQQPAAPHRAGPPPRRGPRAGPGRRSGGAGHHRTRGTAARAHPGSRPRPPALNMERCPGTGVHDVPRHHSGGRDRV
jgi:hypothetical protein